MCGQPAQLDLGDRDRCADHVHGGEQPGLSAPGTPTGIPAAWECRRTVGAAMRVPAGARRWRRALLVLLSRARICPKALSHPDRPEASGLIADAVPAR